MKQLLLLLVCLSLLTACGSLAPIPTPYPTLPPTPTPELAVSNPNHVTLPLDESPHGDLTEWWYYTGHLRTTTTPIRHYGFEFVIFQVRRGDNPPVYDAHFAITNDNTRTFHFTQRYTTGEQGGRGPGFNLTVGGWRLVGANGNDHLIASMQAYAINLQLHATKPAVLQGGTGLINFGIFGKSYYYSRTRLAVTGFLVDHAMPLAVTGEAWMDHQWGNFIVASVGGWDWMSIQLTNDVDIMLAFLRDPQGKVFERFGSYVLPSGQVTYLSGNEFTQQVLGQWTSPITHITYPSGWRVVIPHQHAALTLIPTVRNQELSFGGRSGATFLDYWEGEVTVKGTDASQPARGRGYVELTGYRNAH